jgi:hypothetical protein
LLSEFNELAEEIAHTVLVSFGKMILMKQGSFKPVNKKSQIKKDQLLAELRELRTRLLTEASSLPAEKRDIVFLGIWSVKDLLAHMVGWDYTNIEAAKNVLDGKVPNFYSHQDRDWKTYNALLVKKYKRDSFDELLTAARDSQNELIEFLQTVPPRSFNKDFGVRFRGYKVTIQRLLEADAKDEQVHYQQIKDFLEKG